MASNNKVIITCAVTGAIHTPSMSPHLPVTPDEIAAAAIGAAEAGAAIVHLHARDPVTGTAGPEAGSVRPLPAAHQAGDQRGHQPDHRRRALHDRAGAGEAGRDLQAGSRLPQHGLDEFRAVSDAEPLQDLQARLGGAGAREFARPRLPQHVQGYRVRAAHAGRRRHALRVRVLRHRASLQSRPFPRTRARQAAAVRADGVRHPRRHRARIPRT